MTRELDFGGRVALAISAYAAKRRNGDIVKFDAECEKFLTPAQFREVRKICMTASDPRTATYAAVRSIFAREKLAAH